MSLELYLAFVFATVVLILFPGPVVTLVVATSLRHGTGPALVTVAGSSSAILGHLLITSFGMTSVLLVMSHWFEWLRWAGVAYLVYLGVRQWRAEPLLPDAPVPAVSGRRLFWQGFLVNATNPKTLFFYAAFFPQFVDPAAPALQQLALLSVTFLVVATALDSSYALAAGRLRGLFRSRRVARIRDRVTGTLLIGAGLGLALARRP